MDENYNNNNNNFQRIVLWVNIIIEMFATPQTQLILMSMICVYLPNFLAMYG